MSNTYCIFEAQATLGCAFDKKDLDQYLLKAPHQDILREIAKGFEDGATIPSQGDDFCSKDALFFDTDEILWYADKHPKDFNEELLDFSVDEREAIWGVWSDNIECTVPKYACWLANKKFGVDANLYVQERYMSLYHCSNICYSVEPSTKIVW
ncbi:hypothetical protein [Synechococcus sp. WH 8016]|uniref:hypothetical protein n=1 Tax=Synechococcus sp. WH 8016 TaxID=166318 RepID=UPI00022DA20F|nr:hypothetical protein [Synechococcus sp. WH 8016]EHA60580.1 hypothetical protein Syn8016DRAFT_2367 [Synechococcus sp. WH 8016]